MKLDTRLEIEGRIKELLASELKVDPRGITGSTPLLHRGIALDSIEALTLVLAVENEFGIQVADAELTTRLFWNIETLAEYVRQKMLEQTTGQEDQI